MFNMESATIVTLAFGPGIIKVLFEEQQSVKYVILVINATTFI